MVVKGVVSSLVQVGVSRGCALCMGRIIPRGLWGILVGPDCCQTDVSNLVQVHICDCPTLLCSVREAYNGSPPSGVL